MGYRDSNFCNVFFKSAKGLSVSGQGKLNPYIDPAVDRYKHLPVENIKGDIISTESTQEGFKNSLQSFVRLYSFLTQIMPFTDVNLEQLYTYCKFLFRKLPRYANDRFQLGDKVAKNKRNQCLDGAR